MTDATNTPGPAEEPAPAARHVITVQQQLKPGDVEACHRQDHRLLLLHRQQAQRDHDMRVVAARIAKIHELPSALLPPAALLRAYEDTREAMGLMSTEVQPWQEQ